MDNKIDKEIYRKLQKLYEEMGWFQPFPSLEELLDDESQNLKTISVRIRFPDSINHKSEKEKRSKKKKKGQKSEKNKKNGKE